MAARTVVTGGVRSGKSTYAESLLREAQHVTYVAPGPAADPAVDLEWAERVAAHQARRPSHWTTVETTDVAGALTQATGAVLVDCLGTWLTRRRKERSARHLRLLQRSACQPEADFELWYADATRFELLPVVSSMWRRRSSRRRRPGSGRCRGSRRRTGACRCCRRQGCGTDEARRRPPCRPADARGRAPPARRRA